MRRIVAPLLAVLLAAPAFCYDQWVEPSEMRALVEEKRGQLQSPALEPPLQYVRFDDWAMIEQLVKRLRSEGKDVLVTTDLDNTLLTTLQDLGSEQWFDGMYEALKPLKAKNEALFNERFEKLLDLNFKVLSQSKTEPVQENVPQIVANIQAMGAKMIGLTSRGGRLAAGTLRNLESWNIDLARSAIGTELEMMGDKFPANASYAGGVFFTAGNNKGKMLMSLLKNFNYRPDVVIFVDDKSSHHDKMFASCLAENLVVFGYQYTLEHPFIVDYKKSDKARSRVQMKHFFETGELMSDHAAELKAGPVPSWAEVNALVYGVADPTSMPAARSVP